MEGPISWDGLEVIIKKLSNDVSGYSHSNNYSKQILTSGILLFKKLKYFQKTKLT